MTVRKEKASRGIERFLLTIVSQTQAEVRTFGRS